MPTKPRTKPSKSVTVPPFYKRRRVIIIGVTIVVIITLLLLRMAAGMLFNQSYYSGDKQHISSNMSSFLDKVQLGKAPLYQALVDQGCTENGVGLATRVTCAVEGDKFYEDTGGDISADLHALDTLFRKEGWHQVFISTSDQQILNGSEEGDLTYTPNSTRDTGRNPYASITVYKNGLSSSDTTINNLIQAKKILPPTAGSTIFGVEASETYWSCSEDSILLPCPAPPSTPHL